MRPQSKALVPSFWIQVARRAGRQKQRSCSRMSRSQNITDKVYIDEEILREDKSRCNLKELDVRELVFFWHYTV